MEEPSIIPAVTEVNTLVPASQPAMKRPRKSGTLNVLDPFPSPYRADTTANNAEYVVRLTACPLQRRYPLGAALTP